MAIFDVPSLFIVGVGILREKNHFLLDKSLQSNIIGVKKKLYYICSVFQFPILWLHMKYHIFFWFFDVTTSHFVNNYQYSYENFAQ